MDAAAQNYDERIALANGELERLVKRLGSLSALAWVPRQQAVASALNVLVALTGSAEHRVVPELPSIADHALADAVAVIGGDVIAALGADPDVDLLAALLAALREALAATR